MAVQLSFVETRGEQRRSGQIRSARFLLSISPHPCLPLSPAGILLSYFISFSSYRFSSIDATNRKRPSSLLLEQALHFSRLLSFSPSLFWPYSPNHAPSNISPLDFPRFRLVPPRQSGLRSTRTPRLLVRDTLPSPGERKSYHSASGHADGADD